MNDQDLIDTLLKCQEADDLDFKSEQYRLDNNQRKSQFIKDIVAMANTPRAGPAYIVIGVAEKAGKITDVPGVNEHPDEAEFGKLVSSKVNPAPIFNYRSNTIQWDRVRSDRNPLRPTCAYNTSSQL